MAKLREKDGLNRRQRVENIRVADEMKLIDDRLHSMGQRLTCFYQHINYYNLQNKKEGTFDQLIRSSVFLVTSNIREFKLEKEEKDFLTLLGNNYYNPHRKEELLIEKIIGLITLFESWLNVTSYFGIHDFELTLRTDLINQVAVNLNKTTSQLFNYVEKKFKKFTLPNLSKLWNIEKSAFGIDQPSRFYKSAFYKFFNSIQFLQKNLDLYEKEVFSSGYNDPSIAIMIAFLQNHNKVMGNFNNRWKEYSQFYLEKILKAQPAKAIPDYTILQIKKNEDKEWIEIPQGTAFLADEKTKFHSTEPLFINNVTLKSILGLYEEMDEIIEPASGLGFVTALKKVDLSSLIDAVPGSGTSQPIFVQKGKKGTGNTSSLAADATIGLLIRSWTLLLKEGIRNVTLKLVPAGDTIEEYEQLITRIIEKWGGTEHDVTFKLLHDIFYIKVSTAEGWRNIESYDIQFDYKANEPVFEISFSVDESFPPICPVEGESSSPPSIQLLLNRNSWLFPYSWLKELDFCSVRIIASVSMLTNIQLYSELGKLDTTMPFYPFGMLPARGSWMVLGNYEMAVKKIASISIKIKWANLPADKYGFADYYLQYQKSIDNCSFTVEPEVLKNRRWFPVKGKKSYFLFNTDTGNSIATLPKAPLKSETILGNIIPDDFVRQKIREEDFGYNMFASNGFFRVKLTNPEMGFGHQHYQRILSDVLIQNARTKKLVPVPNPPFSPQAEYINIDYVSEDEISVTKRYEGFGESLSHLHPFGENVLDIFGTQKAFRIVPDFINRGNLLFGFDNVIGGETIRLYTSLLPQQKEIDRDKFPEIVWYYGDEYGWTLLPQNNVLRDETRKLLESGTIEIKIPDHIHETETSLKNLFWLRASISKNVENLSDVKGFYLHVLKVERELSDDIDVLKGLNSLLPGKISEPQSRIPGLAEVIQLVQTAGGKIAEDEITMRVRLSERISHRNRAVNAIDFEKIVLENFGAIKKAKCFPCTDSKQNRPGVVTIAVIPETDGKVRTPMAGCKLLIDIEDFLQGYSNMFATIDVINPVYEYLQVRCKVTLKKTRSEGFYLRLLNHEINNYIAYWEMTDEAPVFGHTISLIDLSNFIRSLEYVVRIRNFSVLHLREEEEFLYQILEKGDFEMQETDSSDLKTNIRVLLNSQEIKMKELKPITPSKPWSIIIPMDKHLLVAEWEDQVERAGISELEIGNTFVIS
jgi:hypothetical protein